MVPQSQPGERNLPVGRNGPLLHSIQHYRVAVGIQRGSSRYGRNRDAATGGGASDLEGAGQGLAGEDRHCSWVIPTYAAVWRHAIEPQRVISWLELRPLDPARKADRLGGLSVHLHGIAVRVHLVPGGCGGDLQGAGGGGKVESPAS